MLHLHEMELSSVATATSLANKNELMVDGSDPTHRLHPPLV